VLIYLQARGWLLMPPTRHKSTPTYEAALRSLEHGRLAVVSVKSGDAEVPVPQLEVGDAKAFAFGDNMSAPPKQHEVERINPVQIEQFMDERPELQTRRSSSAWRSSRVSRPVDDKRGSPVAARI
jgi:hypothetical protein